MSPLLRIKRLDPLLPLPAYQTAGASGIDLYAAESHEIEGFRSWLIGTAIAVEIPPGFEGQVRPRSSMSRQSIIAPVGTIDSDYRGEIGVILYNARPGTLVIEKGQRIAQLVIAPVARVTIVEANELSDTARGSGGFGSTGAGMETTK